MGVYDGYEQGKGWSDAAFGACSTTQGSQFQAELEPFEHAELAGKPLRVLDVGFGNGSFLGWARGRGWACDGVEVNERLVERARAKGFDAWQSVESAVQAGRAYDLITAFDVLEHIERTELVLFLKSLCQACHPRTLMLLRFPNGDNPFALPMQNGDVTHRTSIGQAMIRQVAELAGVEVVALREPRQPVEGIALKRRAAVAVGLPLRWAIGQAIRHLFMGGADVFFSSNLIVVLRLRHPPAPASAG